MDIGFKSLKWKIINSLGSAYCMLKSNWLQSIWKNKIFWDRIPWKIVRNQDIEWNHNAGADTWMVKSWNSSTDSNCADYNGSTLLFYQCEDGSQSGWNYCPNGGRRGCYSQCSNFLNCPTNCPKIVQNSRMAAKVDETIAQKEAEETTRASAPTKCGEILECFLLCFSCFTCLSSQN